MKNLYQILTVLFWIVLVVLAFILIGNLSHLPSAYVSIGSVLGLTIGTMFPILIIWIIRYFVGKQIK